mgnify:CR=1 FL=1
MAGLRVRDRLLPREAPVLASERRGALAAVPPQPPPVYPPTLPNPFGGPSGPG